MCNLFGGGQSAAQSTTPAYVPPAQTATSGSVSAATTGVNVKGDNRSGAGVNSRVRANSADDNTVARRRRSASAGLGL